MQSPYRRSAPDGVKDFLAGKKQTRRKSATIQPCAWEGCPKPVLLKNVLPKNLGSSRPSDFCHAHTCIGFEGEAPCFERVQRVQALNGGWWECCAHHQCDADECYFPREYNAQKRKHFDYCRKHKCVRENCERSHPQWKEYCTTHTCYKPDCGVIVEGDEKLCAGHACPMSDCTKRSIGDFFYCNDHICESDPCRNPRTLYLERDNVTLTRYCPIHNCDVANCNNIKMSDPGRYPPITKCGK
ncbi:hypothetical protein V492_07366, partial [Pseudogymnoascus sp. VKM F-4246]